MKSDRETNYVFCQHEGCMANHADHAWGHIKADGWFHSRDGTQAFCPQHLPDWVAGWRAQQAAKKARNK